MMSSIASNVPEAFCSGYVALVGRPNVGKSTLINALVDFKVAIVSSKPQTTRNRIVGIRTDEHSQAIFVDTPGIHQSTKELNRAMLEVVRQAISDVDLVLCLLDSQEKGTGPADPFLLEVIGGTRAPKILVPNKIDLVKKTVLLPLIDRYTRAATFEEVVPISAENKEGLDILMAQVLKRLPPGPRYYPEDQMSDAAERDIAAEIVREKIFLLTKQEIPYSSAVVVEEFKEVPERRLTRIHATIHVEKDSQKGIIIGKGGVMLKEIGRSAREEIERLLGTRVFLELFVRVEKNWTRDPRALRRLGLLQK